MFKVLLSVAVLMLAYPAYAQHCDSVSVKSRATPVYPEIAVMAKLQGTVSVKVELSADGRVISARTSGPQKILNEAAEENIRQWYFASPAAGCGYSINYVYKLEGKASRHPRRTRVIFRLPSEVELIAQPVIPNE